MRVRYHPILAFGLFYIIGLLSLIIVIALSGLVLPTVVNALVHSGYVNVLPMLIAAFAAFRSACANGAPIIRFTHYAPKAVRADFKKHILLYAIAFGLFGMLCDLTTVAVSAAVGMSDGFAYPTTRLLTVSAVYAVAAWLGIKHSFTHPIEAAAELSRPEERATRPVPVDVTDQKWDR